MSLRSDLADVVERFTTLDMPVPVVTLQKLLDSNPEERDE